MADLVVGRSVLNLIIPIESKVKVTTSKRFRQAVLRVEEPDRSFTEHVAFKANYTDLDKWTYTSDSDVTLKEEDWKHREDDIASQLEDLRSYAFGSTFEIVSITTMYQTQYLEAEIRVTAPGDYFTLLAGYDEDHLFITRTHEIANSVAHAHKLLTPDNLPEDAIRVGEYYIIPATEEEHEERMEMYYGPANNDHTCYEDDCWTMNRWDHEEEIWDSFDSDNHMASIVFEVKDPSVKSGTRVFVMGRVYDTSNRHEDVYVPYFSEVIANNEVLNESSSWD